MTFVAVEVTKLYKSKISSHMSLEDQGHADCFLQYPGPCDDRLGSPLARLSLDSIIVTS